MVAGWKTKAFLEKFAVVPGSGKRTERGRAQPFHEYPKPLSTLVALGLEPRFDFGVNHVAHCSLKRLEDPLLLVPMHQGSCNLCRERVELDTYNGVPRGRSPSKPLEPLLTYLVVGGESPSDRFRFVVLPLDEIFAGNVVLPVHLRWFVRVRIDATRCGVDPPDHGGREREGERGRERKGDT